MKKVAKLVVLSLVMVPFLSLGGCAKRCCPEPRPCCPAKVVSDCGPCK